MTASTPTQDSPPAITDNADNDALIQEEQYDLAHCDGAEDSGDEEELGVIEDPPAEEEGDEDPPAEEEDVAEIQESSFVDSNDATVFEDEDEVFFGAPEGWKRPGPPDGWIPNETKTAKGEPEFKDVDNPGNWDKFCYRPIFDITGQKKYKYHSLPTGATPVPIDASGKRMCAGWEFEYQGYIHRDTDLPQFRSGASRDNLFPDERKGCLDKDVLTNLGLNKERMCDAKGKPDSLWFYNLMFPVCDPKMSGVKDDPRLPFYHEVACMSNTYAHRDLKLGSEYGHSFRNTYASELLRWDGVLVMDGVRGGSDGAILRRFKNTDDNTAYDSHIADAFTGTRWLELKRVMKLCYNGCPESDKSHPSYNPAYKFDYIYKVLLHNVNAVTK
jgi:hypothetical protein